MRRSVAIAAAAPSDRSLRFFRVATGVLLILFGISGLGNWIYGFAGMHGNPPPSVAERGHVALSTSWQLVLLLAIPGGVALVRSALAKMPR